MKRNLPLPLAALFVAGKLLSKAKFFQASAALQNANRAILRDNGQKPLALKTLEHSVLSEYGEAGIIDGIFQVIGRKTKKIIEFGFHPTQANCMNEVLFQKMDTLFIDASSLSPKVAQQAFRILGRPGIKTLSGFVTVDNVNKLFRDNGFSGEIDILSIDIDSNDYWVWQAIEVVSPRLVIMEYNDRLGPDLPITIKYDPNYAPIEASNGFYEGASLAALDKLAKAKGYRLIGCESSGVNAFFLRNDIQAPQFPTVTVAEAFLYHRRSVASGLTDEQRRQHIAKFPFVYV
ncbi:hypothetical protein [Methylocapsa aurea]|uniref:hypothetical protein n=1 Tax=Methylocapsa aurea TaxID=663610 RepID=UPI000689D9A7|nr:hypothetical protein [Methylocapsa aurea]